MVPRMKRSLKRFIAIFITFFISVICINSFTGPPQPPEDGYIFSFERLLEGPAVLQQNDTQLLEHIRANVFINPEDYEVSLEILTILPNAIPKLKRLFQTEVPLVMAMLSSTENQTNLLPPVSKATSGLGEVNQSAVVDKFFKRKLNGFFIEAGAWDGEYLSNTLFFERNRNWTGLLVEANRLAFKTMVLRGTRKRSVAANVCLSLNSYPRKMTFDAADVFGGVISQDHLPERDIIGENGRLIPLIPV